MQGKIVTWRQFNAESVADKNEYRLRHIERTTKKNAKEEPPFNCNSETDLNTKIYRQLYQRITNRSLLISCFVSVAGFWFHFCRVLFVTTKSFVNSFPISRIHATTSKRNTKQDKESGKKTYQNLELQTKAGTVHSQKLKLIASNMVCGAKWSRIPSWSVRVRGRKSIWGTIAYLQQKKKRKKKKTSTTTKNNNNIIITTKTSLWICCYQLY